MKRIVIKLVFYVFAAVGLILQLKDVVKDYFAYKTSSKVELLRQADSVNPALVFCVRFTDVLNRSNYKKYGIYPTRHNDPKKIQEDFSLLTVRDVFDLTPNSTDFIQECEYRHDSYHTTKHTKSECTSLFKVLKFFNRQDICYRIVTAKITDDFKCGDISLSLYDPTKMYSITLTDEFEGAHMISMVSSYAYRDYGDDSVFSIPFESRKFAKRVLRLKDFDQNITDRNSFYISIMNYQLEFMPPPYDTMCTRISEKWKTGCELDCEIKIYGKYGRIPPSKATTDPSDLKIISEKDLKNKSMIESIKMEKIMCKKSCLYEWCTDHFSVTELTDVPSNLTSISLASTCSPTPTHKLIFYPKHKLDELLIYITSSFGVWFGFSFVALNPTTAVTKITKLRKQKITDRRSRLQPKRPVVK